MLSVLFSVQGLWSLMRSGKLEAPDTYDNAKEMWSHNMSGLCLGVCPRGGGGVLYIIIAVTTLSSVLNMLWSASK